MASLPSIEGPVIGPTPAETLVERQGAEFRRRIEVADRRVDGDWIAGMERLIVADGGRGAVAQGAVIARAIRSLVTGVEGPVPTSGSRLDRVDAASSGVDHHCVAEE